MELFSIWVRGVEGDMECEGKSRGMKVESRRLRGVKGNGRQTKRGRRGWGEGGIVGAAKKRSE